MKHMQQNKKTLKHTWTNVTTAKHATNAKQCKTIKTYKRMQTNQNITHAKKKQNSATIAINVNKSNNAKQ